MPANYLGASSQVDINGLLSHTTTHIDKKNVIQDAVFGANPFLYVMKEKGRVEVSGGERLQVNLLYGANSTFGSYSRYDVLDISPQDGMGAAYYPWAQYSISVSIDGLTTLQNAGPARIKDLVKSKFEQATMTIADEMNKHILACETIVAAGSTGNNGKNIISLPMLVDYDPDRDVAVGGINPNDYSWWENNVLDYGGTNTFTVMKAKMNKIYHDCQKQGRIGGPPDLILASQQAYENYEASLEEYKRYTTGDEKMASAGFEALKYKGATMVWDEYVPQPENAADYDGGNTDDEAMYFLNTSSLGLYILGGRDWKWGEWEKPVDQDAKVNTALWAGQLAVRNRRKNGLLYGITDDAPSAS